MHATGRRAPVAVARAVVKRADGTTETHYSIPRIPWHHFRRRLKLWTHLRLMRAEDKET